MKKKICAQAVILRQRFQAHENGSDGGGFGGDINEYVGMWIIHLYNTHTLTLTYNDLQHQKLSNLT